MPVTYTCPHCDATLRTANPVAAGRVVRCPKCNEQFTPVPVAEDEPAAGVFQLADEPKGGAKAPAKKVAPPAPKPEPRPEPPPAPKKPFADDEDEEDAESLRRGYGVLTESEEELAKVEANKPKFGELKDKFARSARGPAMAMLVQPSNLLTFEGFATAASGVGIFVWGMWPLVFSEGAPGDEETQEAIMMMLGGLMVFAWGAVICVGAAMMQNLQSYTWAIVGSVMGILPLLAGIYALTILRNPKVIAGFEEVDADDVEEKPDEDEDDEDEDDDED